jgi:hypothetical protein
MTTLRKNGKDYKRAISKIINLRVYSLENDFHPKLANEIPSFALEMGRVVKMLDNYRLSVHSNLWYEWASA